MIRKYAVILATLFMVVQLAACGNWMGQAGYESGAPQTADAAGSPQISAVSPTATPGTAPMGTPFPSDATAEWPTGTASAVPQLTDDMHMSIRSADEVDFPDCISFVLPQGLTAGDFNIYLGHGGGLPILNDMGMLCGCVELHLYGSAIFEDGELVGIKPFANHAYFSSEFTSVSSGAPCVAVKYTKDIYDGETYYYLGERSMWYAFWAKEGCEPIYAIYLFADLYGYDDLIAIARSVTFSDKAFVAR